MVTCFLGEIRAFAFGITPRSWAPCDGRPLNISEYNALYALIGTTFGGNGITTFCLPDLRGRAAISYGSGPGLTPRVNGQQCGTETVTMGSSEIPQHSHTLVTETTTGILKCKNTPGTVKDPTDNSISANVPPDQVSRFNTAAPDTSLHQASITFSGTTENNSGIGHPNMQPYTVINYCICLTGVFPSRN